MLQLCVCVCVCASALVCVCLDVGIAVAPLFSLESVLIKKDWFYSVCLRGTCCTANMFWSNAAMRGTRCGRTLSNTCLFTHSRQKQFYRLFTKCSEAGNLRHPCNVRDPNATRLISEIQSCPCDLHLRSHFAVRSFLEKPNFFFKVWSFISRWWQLNDKPVWRLSETMCCMFLRGCLLLLLSSNPKNLCVYVCVCVWVCVLVLAPKLGPAWVFNQRSEVIFGKWGHFGWSSLCCQDFWGLRLCFGVRVRVRHLALVRAEARKCHMSMSVLTKTAIQTCVCVYVCAFVCVFNLHLLKVIMTLVMKYIYSFICFSIHQTDFSVTSLLDLHKVWRKMLKRQTFPCKTQ